MGADGPHVFLERVMGILLQKMRLELALRAAFSRLLTKVGGSTSDSSTGRTAIPFDSHPSEQKHMGADGPHVFLERVMGIEPTLSAWEADALPLSYTRVQM